MGSNDRILQNVLWFVVAVIMILLLALIAGCGQAPETSADKAVSVREFAGFLDDYSNLKPNPNLQGEVLTHVSPDKGTRLHRYVAIMIDPVEVYSHPRMSEQARAAIARFSGNALRNALCGAFTVVEEPGPLTLRLRAAVVGIDVEGETNECDMPDTKFPERTFDDRVAHIEVELLDSESGKRIAAMVDTGDMGAGVTIRARQFCHAEKFQSADHASEDWAIRVREFLDMEREFHGPDRFRSFQSYYPYS